MGLIVVNSHDVNGWINAIRYLKSHPHEANEMGQKSYRLAIEKYNDTNFVKTIYGQIKQMINNMSSDIVETNQYINEEERRFIKLLRCFPLLALIIEKLSIYRKELISIRFNRHEKSVRCFYSYLYKGNNNA